MGGLVYMEWKGCEFDTMCIKQPWTLISAIVTLNLFLDFQGQILKYLSNF